MAEAGGWIRLRGARTHNLQSFDVQLFHNRLTVITGFSGSATSSLAFDTLDAESQRRGELPRSANPSACPFLRSVFSPRSIPARRHRRFRKRLFVTGNKRCTHTTKT